MASMSRRLFNQLIVGTACAFGFMGQGAWAVAEPKAEPVEVHEYSLANAVSITDQDENVEWIPDNEFDAFNKAYVMDHLAAVQERERNLAMKMRML